MFSQVIGLEQSCNFLKQTIEKKQLSTSYLFVGPTGRGKSFLASNLAKAILCKQEKPVKLVHPVNFLKKFSSRFFSYLRLKNTIFPSQLLEKTLFRRKLKKPDSCVVIKNTKHSTKPIL